MNIKIKCPVCNGNNTLTPTSVECRRCKEDLSILYITRGYSFKYRLQLAQALPQPMDSNVKKSIAQAAVYFTAPKS